MNRAASARVDTEFVRAAMGGGAAKLNCRSDGTLPFCSIWSLVASCAKPCRFAICHGEDAWLTNSRGKGMTSKHYFAQEVTLVLDFFINKMVGYMGAVNST